MWHTHTQENLGGKRAPFVLTVEKNQMGKVEVGDEATMKNILSSRNDRIFNSLHIAHEPNILQTNENLTTRK